MLQQARIVRYVKGELSEAEQQELEAAYFADPDLLREVQAVYNDLLDAYLTEEMPLLERQQFAERLRTLPYLREQLESSRALLQVANRNTTASPQPKTTERQPQVESRWNARRNALVPRLALACTAVLLLLGGYGWQARRGTPAAPAAPAEIVVAQSTATPSALPSVQTTATPSASVPSVKPPVKDVPLPVLASLLLSTEVTRSENASARLVVPSAKGLVRLQLELAAKPAPSYQAMLRTAQGQSLKHWDRVVPVWAQKTAVINLQVPTQLLPPGDYVVSLRAGATASSEYRFSVQPR